MNPINQHCILLALGIAISLSAFSPSTWAFEGDVHFGLTRWLALRAGFSEPQADAIAIANQRVDGGLVESTELDLEYACAGHFPDVARQAQRQHYPAAASVPAPPADRIVQAGGAAALHELGEVFAAAKGKEGLMLGKFGHALHPLQDSWSHQGTPSQKQFGQFAKTLACDATLASGHPLARGGPDSHAADLTMRWPADTLAMARATYEQLLAWGDTEGLKRKPAAWDSLMPAISEFAMASSKTQKRAWFVSQGMPGTQFLEGVSLPDGPDPGPLNWTGRMLPPLPSVASRQHDAPADVRAFFDRFLARWLGAEKVEDVVADLGTVRGGPVRDGDVVPRELIARLKLWKLRDHGAAAVLAHAAAPLGESQLKAVERMARGESANIAATSVADAVFSLQPSTPQPMPMLPYLVRALPNASGAQRMIAIARLKHAPYDTVGWIAEKRGERWVLTDMVASVDL